MGKIARVVTHVEESAMQSEVKRDVLEQIRKHDGKWYWYQLDRYFVGVHPHDKVRAAVRDLAASNLIEMRPNASLGEFPCYWLTEAGRTVLAAPISPSTQS